MAIKCMRQQAGSSGRSCRLCVNLASSSPAAEGFYSFGRQQAVCMRQHTVQNIGSLSQEMEGN